MDKVQINMIPLIDYLNNLPVSEFTGEVSQNLQPAHITPFSDEYPEAEQEPPFLGANLATPEWRAIRDKFYGHVCNCRLCCGVRGYYCEEGRALYEAYINTPHYYQE